MKQAVILAAGRSSRFWPLNRKHKSLIKVMGKPLIFYTLKGLEEAGFLEVIIIQRDKKDVEAELGKYNLEIKIKYISITEPKGMGNALWQAKDLLDGRFLVLNAERVDIGDIIKEYDSKYKSILFGQKTDNPELFGIMRVEGDKVLEIVEKPKKGEEPSDIRIVGAYILEPRFFEAYQGIEKHTYDFEDALSKYIKENDTGAVVLDKAPSLKYPWHLFEMERYLFDKFLEKRIESSAQISEKAVIEGDVYIGKNTKVYENAVIKGPCYIGDNCIIGTNSLVREYCDLENDVLIGANSEVARSVFQEGVHIHSNFIGDSVLGKGCRIGAGTITANKRIDGKEVKSTVAGQRIGSGLEKLGCIMGEESKIGINCSLMPGVMIGNNSAVGPNSLIMKNIEDNTLFYAKFQEVEKRA